MLMFLIPAVSCADESEDITMIFGGDVMLGWGYLEVVPDPYDFSWPFLKLKPLFDAADIVMVNLENAVTTAKGKISKQFNFKMDPALLPILTEGGIDIVTLANNHVFDFGSEGLADTLRNLDNAGIPHVGAGMTLAEARRPVILTIKGRTVGFLGYGNYAPATADRPGTVYRYPELVREDVRALKAQGVDLIVVNFHWGVELMQEPQESDRLLARHAIESGADIIVGHHPHVVQPVEVYEGKVIAWSLGNFIFGGNSKRPDRSILLKVTASVDGTLRPEVLPIRINPQETRYQPYLIEEAAGNERELVH